MESDTSPQVVDANGSNTQVSAAVLLIVGEPATADHKNLILGEITKGFRCWDCPDVDINDELAHIANAAELGVEGPNGERVLNYGTEKMATMIVVNSHLETLTAALKNFLSISAPYKHLIYAGHFFSGNGAWVLQDDTFAISSFAQMCKDKELEDSLKQQNGGKIHFYFSKGGEWKADSLKRLDIFKNSVIAVSSDEKSIDNIHGVLQFTAYIASFINAKTSEDLLRTSDVVGNIRFNKPTLYIFPGSEGDSSLFGVSGFNLLINGGYSRKACFWDLTRHLDRIDSFLMTHLGTDNVFGISTLLKRKSTEYIHPEIGYMYLNGSDKVSHSAVVNGQAEKEPSLCINLSEEGSRLIEYAKQLGHVPQPCTRPVSTQPLQPINLYHKVGHGSLNMYVLNPVSDSKELKDFYQHWNKHLSEHGSLHQIPIQNQLSVCTLLVWQPSDLNEKITRIFFPGNAPQYKILEGLEKMKHLDILKHASCTAKDLEHKPPSAAAKRNSLAAKPAPSKPPVRSSEPPKSARPTADVRRSTEVRASGERKSTEVRSSFDRKKPEPKKEETKTAPPPKPRVPTASSLATKSTKVTKEDENKKMAKKDDKSSKPAKAAPAASKPAAKAKAETKPKKESPTKPVAEKAAAKDQKKEVEEEVPKAEETPVALKVEEPPVLPKVEEPPVVPKVEEPPVAVVEPMQEKSLLDLSPNEPVSDTNMIPETETTEEKHESPEPLPNPTDDYSPNQEQDLMGMGSKMMESFHEGYNGDLMSNDTPTEESGQNLNNFGEYDNNVDIQPEALPEPVEYPPQEAFSQPDMIPTNDRRSQEEKPLISGMAPIEPDVVQGLQYEQEHVEMMEKTSTPLDDRPPMEFDTSEKSITSDSEIPDGGAQDPMQQSLFGGDLGPSETFESLTESESQKSSKAADVSELDQTADDIIEKSMTTSQEQDVIEQQEADDAMETEVKGDNQPDVVQIQEKFEEENVVETENKVQEAVDGVEEEEMSSDDNDSQADIRERHLENLENEKEVIEEQNVDAESPYAFENKAFQQGTESTLPEKPAETKDAETNDAEPQGESEEDIENIPEQQASDSSDEGVVDDKDVEEECLDAEEKDAVHMKESDVGIEVHEDEQDAVQMKESDVGIEVHEDEQDAVQMKESDVGIEVHEDEQDEDENQEQAQFGLDESHEQFSDSLEVSNIPEAFEKDETPDPREVQSNQNALIETEEPQHEGKPMVSMDPFDPFCSTSPNMASLQSSNPFENHQDEKRSSESPLEDNRPINSFGFDPYAQQEQSSFGEVSKQNNRLDSDEEDDELKASPFDPEAEWGKPMGLPSPPPPDDGSKQPTANGKSSAKKVPAKQADAAKKDMAASKAKAKLDTPANGPSNKLNTSRTRPVSAANADAKSKPPPTGKRPSTATGSSRASPAVKTPPLPPFTPFYVDLTYIPNHGNPSYSDIEFFKRVRARYYVLSTLSPNPQTLSALIEAKETWENKNTEVTLIPTYDNDTLRHWMGLNRDKLNELNIDVAPSANRCTIHLQDHETSCSAYRLEF